MFGLEPPHDNKRKYGLVVINGTPQGYRPTCLAFGKRSYGDWLPEVRQPHSEIFNPRPATAGLLYLMILQGEQSLFILHQV